MSRLRGGGNVRIWRVDVFHRNGGQPAVILSNHAHQVHWPRSTREGIISFLNEITLMQSKSMDGHHPYPLGFG